MKKAFTLIELLVVMMIMGLMGTAAVGGYRAMQRGMEERGVMQNVNTMIRAAYQRAQVDRQPTCIIFWNETVRGRSDDENEVVVGRAVAVRRRGRFSNVDGQRLVDEFGDLDQAYPTENSSGASSSTETMYIYPMDNLNDLESSSSLKRSLVKTTIVKSTENLSFLSSLGTTTASGSGSSSSFSQFSAWAFECVNNGGVNWKTGMAYGCEFLDLQLPSGYIFGSNYSTSIEDPIREAGTLVFKVGENNGNGTMTKGGVMGRNSISVYSLRQDGATLQAQSVGTSDSPEKEL